MAVKRPSSPVRVEPGAPRTPKPRPVAPKGPARRVYSAGRHLRAALVFLALSVLVLAVAYPVALVEFGELIDPSAANGSLTYNPNGTVNGSSDLPPNTSSTYGGPQPLAGAGATTTMDPTYHGGAALPGETLSYRPVHGPRVQSLAAPTGVPGGG